MHAIDLLRDPAKLPIRPVYVVYGDDAFLRGEALAVITRRVLAGSDEEDDLAVRRFAGVESKLSDVLDEVRTLPFFSSRRLAIVDEADPFITSHRRELEAYVDHPSEVGVLVLVARTWPSNTKLARLVEQSGTSIDCKGPAERALHTWLVDLARSRFETVLDDDAARLLIELVGPEAGLLVSDLDKLSVYVGERRRIQRADVARMVGGGRIESVWKVLDAATTGQGELALNDLDGLIESGEPPVKVLAGLSFSLMKVYHAGRLRKARVELREACRLAGIPPHAVEKTQQQHSHLGPRRVDQLPRMLLQADLDLKGSSQLEPRVVLERLLIDLARPRSD